MDKVEFKVIFKIYMYNFNYMYKYKKKCNIFMYNNCDMYCVYIVIFLGCL